MSAEKNTTNLNPSPLAVSVHENIAGENVAMEEVSLDINKDNVEEVQAAVADHLLKSEQSWDILNSLYLECANKLLHTRGFTVPVLAQMSVLKEKLNDPDGFQRSFSTLLNDIQAFKLQLDGIQAQHQGKTGTPTEADWPTIFAISQNYSNLISYFESVIAPLIFTLIDVIKAEHGDMLSLEAVA
jgi:hypothetical protein